MGGAALILLWAYGVPVPPPPIMPAELIGVCDRLGASGIDDRLGALSIIDRVGGLAVCDRAGPALVPGRTLIVRPR
jgi:hypothetical protein